MTQERRPRRRRRQQKGDEEGKLTHAHPKPLELNVARNFEYCTSLIGQLEGDDASQMIAADTIHGNVWDLALEEPGCRVVQLALEKKRSIAERVVVELHGHVVEAAFSPHANFVIQKVVETLPIAQSVFVVNEILDRAADIARHRFGCRIIIRLLEHASRETTTAPLLEALLKYAPELCRHAFGKYVMQAVLEHCSHSGYHRHQIAMALHGSPNGAHSLLNNAMHRHASRVIESALTYCDAEDKTFLCEELLRQDDHTSQVAQNRFGSFVWKAMLERK